MDKFTLCFHREYAELKVDADSYEDLRERIGNGEFTPSIEHSALYCSVYDDNDNEIEDIELP